MSTHHEAKGQGVSSFHRKSNAKSTFDGNGDQNENETCQLTMPEDDHERVPLANVARIMRQVLPPHAKISDDAKETIQDCVSKYINIITAKANKRCFDDSRVKVTAEDVLLAMEELKLDQYVDPLKVFLTRYRENENNSSCMHGNGGKRGCYHDDYGPPTGLPQTLEASYGPQNGLPLTMLGTYGPPSSMGPNQNSSVFDPVAMSNFPGGVGSSSFLDTSANFDPFAHLK
ncbi:hypothetical protein L6164_023670 [Bauhinia variegata]|uniref:Uncharacterized protein n=1 Tax=Bauhinia variegata TaxID=167791 RepID=A0ACB9MKJ4_BAUVA|nr:hypothetical protein L6164_023670 [Bauhinia variegata]